MPEVSVVLPAYNAEHTIERAARSILDQTLRDLELIVVNDGSTDDTSAIVRSLNDSRVRLIETSHQGVAEAANVGTKNATAPIIARMDADDYSHPQRLERQLAMLIEQGLDAVGCQVRIADQAGNDVESMHRYERWINVETITNQQISALRFVELPIVNPTILARREYFELGCQNNAFPEDYDLMLRAAAAGMRFGKVAEVLFDWIDRPTRLTRTDSRFTTDAFMQCRRHQLLNGPLADVRQVDLCGVGQTGKPWLRWLQSHRIDVRQAFDVNPRKIGKSIHGVHVRSPEDMPTADGTPLVIAVGAAGARQLIASDVTESGYVIGEDAWFVA